MRITALLLVVLIAAAIVTARPVVRAQTPGGPAFDVVSIKRNTTGALGSSVNERPDGGFTITNVPAGTLISRAYPGFPSVDMVGLPDWAMSAGERFDVSATSPLDRTTPEERAAMMRAMMADRFRLLAHVEQRDQDVYELVLARADRSLGARITPSAEDCEAKLAAEREAARQAAAAGVPPPRPSVDGAVPGCTVRMTGPRMEGDMTMERLALLLRPAAGRVVVDRTGLTGSYRVLLEFDRMAQLRGPDTAASPNAPPSVFTAVEEQLGLRLRSARAPRPVLVIDRLERPTEN